RRSLSAVLSFSQRAPQQSQCIRSAPSSGKTSELRQQHCSSWVFPDWIPSSSDWSREYLPQERQSAAFRVSRDGLQKEEEPLQRLARFQALPPHPLCWDSALFTGGPVWALEWCPAPDGAPATQYLALACHRGMEDRHRADRTHAGPGLVQLWDVGRLEPDRRPSLSYGLALDDGFIWALKWCPAGCWEPPASARKHPLLSRLGLLAVVSSSSVVSVYSLPHPEALLQNQADSGETQEPGTGSPSVGDGSGRYQHSVRSGLVLSVDWLPQKPHNIIAVGFYDGMVGLWDLNTRSALLRVRDSECVSLLPYRCFLAHHNAVRALSFCPASRFLLVTAGDDHNVKTWDLNRLWDPVSVQRRQLVNGLVWTLQAPGVLLTGTRTRPDPVPRPRLEPEPDQTRPSPQTQTGTRTRPDQTQSPDPDWNQNHTRPDPVPRPRLEPEPDQTRSPDSFPRPGPQTQTGTRTRTGPQTQGSCRVLLRRGSLFLWFRSFLCFHDLTFDLQVTFGTAKRTLWKRMANTETRSKVNLDKLPLAALHKVQFSPNLTSHPWLAAGGQSGVVRLHCVRNLTGSHILVQSSPVQSGPTGLIRSSLVPQVLDSQQLWTLSGSSWMFVTIS
uniref:Uncharacterized protein n=1 Tax=Salarias fasciatus TaxID=181472 RepID=A0A672I7Z4_SALFA